MSGFIDLHCHWLWDIDDGARSRAEAEAILAGLRGVGFSRVYATPHMRPGLFDNISEHIETEFRAKAALLSDPGLELRVGCEHFLDDTVYERLLTGKGRPYSNTQAILLELSPLRFPLQAERCIANLRKGGLSVVLAHPERYQPVWEDDSCLDPLLDAGAQLLLDVAALMGKYGRAAQKAAEKLLDEDTYEAACSDTHRPTDVADVARGIDALAKRVGHDEVSRLLISGPKKILGEA